ncbi:MAG: phage virion morphogenesis protein [Candidatus Gastranaerophilaceae bacterium]
MIQDAIAVIEIPARPYLKITDKDQQEIIDLIVKYIEK